MEEGGSGVVVAQSPSALALEMEKNQERRCLSGKRGKGSGRFALIPHTEISEE